MYSIDSLVHNKNTALVWRHLRTAPYPDELMDLLFRIALHHVVRPVGRHSDDGDAEVDPQHVDDAEAEEGQTGDDVATFHVGKTSSEMTMMSYNLRCMRIVLRI